MDDLINELIQDRFKARLYGHCRRYVLNKTGCELNESQIKAIDFILKKDRSLIIKGRQIGISLLLEAIEDFYVNENKNVQLIGLRDNTKLNKDLDLLIRDELNGDTFNELDRVDYSKTKVIIASCAESTDSFLYKELYLSDDYANLKLPSSQQTIDSVRGLMPQSDLLREFACHFIKH